MRLSKLQQFILTQAYLNRPRCSRKFCEQYYKNPSEQQIKIVTVSIERLIAKGLLKGYGYKTAEKLFIQHVSLTRRGVTEALRSINERQRLPFKKPRR